MPMTTPWTDAGHEDDAATGCHVPTWSRSAGVRVVTDEDLKRMLGMNAPLATLSPVEFDALSHRIAALPPEHKLRIEAILRRGLQPDPTLIRSACHGPHGNERAAKRACGAVRFKFVRTLAFIFITIHSFAVTIVLLRLLHR